MSIDQRIRDGLRATDDRLPAPDVDHALAAVTTGVRPHRREAVTALVAAAAVVAVVVGVLALTRGGEDPVRPVGPPTPTDAVRDAAAPDPPLPARLTRRLRQIRDDGSRWPDGSGSPSPPLLRDPATGLKVQLYGLCDGGPCPLDADMSQLQGTPRALEVSDGSRSALFDVADAVRFVVDGMWWLGVNARAFDGDSVLVQDVTRVGGPIRFRLLQADGTAYTLRTVRDPAPARLAPGVVALERPAGRAGRQNLYLVDDRVATIRPVDVPDDRPRSWTAYDGLLLGVADACRLSWLTADGLHERRLDCGPGGRLAAAWTDLPDGWPRPGRMVVTEWVSHGSNLVNRWEFFVHASTDDGATWHRLPLGHDDGSLSTRIAEALRGLE
ncbi:hypothetical protein FHP29_07780 [Nocardioides albidus]|uniref:Uncharacterized protein n=1 Tax=Nocardioides albidus TaxID=1517589 RepID=A0A5C4W0Y6_9ACTN|nr:hypothetical protein [Nocardioides albidus]TNM41870.1 hypothetical protein FHP29_07780 [Nocardioides albidus]